MTTSTDATSESNWIEARLPSGRNVRLRSVDLPGRTQDDDEGLVQDVRFRSIDFRVVTATLHEIGDLISNAVRPLAPSEAEVELGLGLSAGTGQLLVLFGEASAEASIKVKLSWSFDREPEDDKKA